MKQHNLLKKANSKGALAKAVVAYQRALSHYANESNWAVKTIPGDPNHPAVPDDELIIWLGDDDPTYAAAVSLGKRKPDPAYNDRNKKAVVREPDRKDDTSNVDHQRQGTAS